MNHPGFGRDSLLGSGDQTDQVTQLVQGLELNRWPASAGSVQSTVVIPIHPCRGGDVDFLNSMPRPARFNQLGLVQAYQRFRQSVVEGVADGADRGLDTRIDQVLSEPE